MEKMLVWSTAALPCSFEPLNKIKLKNLKPFFEIGRQIELDPVQLIADDMGLLTYNGHHRLALADKYKKMLNGNLYRLGDEIEFEGEIIIVDKQLIQSLRSKRSETKFYGINTFNDLYAASFGELSRLLYSLSSLGKFTYATSYS